METQPVGQLLTGSFLLPCHYRSPYPSSLSLSLRSSSSLSILPPAVTPAQHPYHSPTLITTRRRPGSAARRKEPDRTGPRRGGLRRGG